MSQPQGEGPLSSSRPTSSSSSSTSSSSSFSSSTSSFRGRPSTSRATHQQQAEMAHSSSAHYHSDRDVSPTSSYHSAGDGERTVTSAHLPPPPRTRPPTQPAPDFSQRGEAFAEDDDSSLLVTCHPPDKPPSFVFVCLGVGGGPLENDCSCYMVKPAGRDWRQGSFVLEGGSWLGALSKLCDPNTSSPAFSDFPFTHTSPSIRAGEVGSHAKAFLITHAHLDHILGMVLGSASLPGKRAVYGLRSTLDNLLGIFDGKLWPKLASLDENAPFIVYHCRPIECQKTIHLDDAISVLPFALSHGLNMSTVPEPPTPQPQPLSAACYFSKRYSLPLNSLMGSSSPMFMDQQHPSPLLTSNGSSAFNRTTFTSPFAPDRSTSGGTPVIMERSNSSSAASSPRIPQNEELQNEQSMQPPSSAPPSRPVHRPTKTRRPKTASGSEKADPPASDLQLVMSNELDTPSGGASASSNNGSGRTSNVTTPLVDSSKDACNGAGSGKATPHHHTHTGGGATMDSTAFFLTNKGTGQEVLFFGDVEPDCVSRSPRNRRVWQHAASRFASGRLNTVFLECSFPAAQPTEFLWGHLSTSHLYDELKVLARCVKSERAVLARTERANRDPRSAPPRLVNFSRPMLNEPLPVIPSSPLVPTSNATPADLHGVLNGLTIIVIHAKQAFFPSYSGEDEGKSEGPAGSTSPSSRKGSRVLDPRTMQERILQELQEVEEENRLGVRFVMSKQGMRIEV